VKSGSLLLLIKGRSAFKTITTGNDSPFALWIVDYFENREREERFISKIAELILNTSTRPNPHFIGISATSANIPATSNDEESNEHIDFDFVGG
jgi:hypothetical protein